MAVATQTGEGDAARRASGRRDSGGASRPRKALTIGAVAKILGQEFDDISISKIRYLEDQKLLAPRRTQGGYRLYSQADVERLRAILRMQRDEFLPLRVIRQELATGDFTGARRGSEAAATRRAGSVDAPVSTLTLEELLDEAGVSEALLRELQEFGIVQPERREGRLGLRRDRPRDRPCRSRALAVRGRGAEPSGVPDFSRSGGRPAPAARGSGASLPKPGSPQGGDREPREPRGGLRAPEASAPGPRFAPPQGRLRVRGRVASGERGATRLGVLTTASVVKSTRRTQQWFRVRSRRQPACVP